MIKALDYELMCDCLQPGCQYCDQDGSRSKGMMDIFKLEKPELVYFIEQNYSGKWLMDECNFTSDPNEAMAFHARQSAEVYMNNRAWLKECYVTEH